jgi:hypothetical protein
MRIISNPLQACWHILLDPKAVFNAVKLHNNWSWIPFFLVMTFILTPVYAYYQFVDFNWYQDFYVSYMAGDVSPAERDMILAGLQSKPVFVISNLVTFFVGYVVLAAVIAIYLNIMTKADELNVNGFTDWFGFVWWTQLPLVLTGVTMLLMIALSSDNQTSMYGLQPLSLGYWLGLNEQSKWIGLADQCRIELWLTFYLMLVGLRQWTHFSIIRISLILFVPYLLLVGMSASIAFWLA